MRAQDIMTEPALTCTPDTSLALAASFMRDADYGTLPVVDAGGRVVGIITDRDVCLALAATNRNALNIAVHEVMTKKVLFVLADDDVHDVLALMKRHRVRRVPVCEDSARLRGIVSIEDMVVHGLERGGITPDELVDALRAMYSRLPAAAESADAKDEFTPG